MQLGFQTQFVMKVETGAKRQTVRADRKDGRPHAQVGMPIDLCAGVRTKQFRKIGTGTCVDYERVTLIFGPGRRMQIGSGVIVSGQLYLDGFAQLDGFADWAALEAWFADTHEAAISFSGWLIRWRPDWLTEATTPKLRLPNPKETAKQKRSAR